MIRKDYGVRNFALIRKIILSALCQTLGARRSAWREGNRWLLATTTSACGFWKLHRYDEQMQRPRLIVSYTLVDNEK